MPTTNEVLNQLSGGFQVALEVAFYMIIVAVVGVIAWFVWRHLQYKYLADIHYVNTSDQRHKGSVEYAQTVKARMFKKKNRLHLKKLNVKIPIPHKNYWVRWGKTWKVTLQHDGIQMFAPAIPKYNSPLNFSSESYDILEQFIQRGKDKIARHAKTTWWDENKSTVLFLSSMAFAIIVMVLVFDTAGDVISTAVSEAKGLIAAPPAVPSGEVLA